MDLRKYFAPLLIWWWLVLLCGGVATGVAYVLVKNQPPVFLSRTTLMIGRAILNPNPSETDFGLSQQLARVYADIALRDVVREKTRQALGLTLLPRYTATVKGQFLELAVTDTDANRARLVADQLARQLILQSPSGQETTDQARQAFVNKQLDDLQVKIKDTEQEIATQQANLENQVSAAEIADTQQVIAGLETRLTTLQTNYANLLAGTKQGATNQLSVLEPAATPYIPIGPNKPLIIGLAAFSGILLALAAAYVLEFLDDTLKTPEDIGDEFKYPIIGYLAEMGRSKQGLPYVAEKPFSLVAEEFRTLRTNLEFSGIDQSLRTLLVTSAVASDGKTSVAANLAFVMAQGGKRVILLDADMRQSSVSAHIQVPERIGLSDVFRGQLTPEEALQAAGESVRVMLSGTRPPNPAELLASKRMDQILQALVDMSDIVIVDGPPFLLSDATILASKVDGVLVVSRPGHTPRGAVRAMVTQVKRIGVRIVGIAVNRLPTRHVEHYGGYRYIVNYKEAFSVDDDDAPRPGKAWQGLLQQWRKRLLPGTRKKLPAPANAAPEIPTAAGQGAVPQLVEDADQDNHLKVQRLLEMSEALADSPDLRQTVQRVLPLAMESVGAPSGSVVLFDEAGRAFGGIFAYAGALHDSTAQQLLDVVEKGLAGWVYEHQQPTLVTNTRDDDRWLRRTWDQSAAIARSAASVPLMQQGRVVGVLTVVSPEVGQFNRGHLAMLTAIAVGITLQRDSEKLAPVN